MQVRQGGRPQGRGKCPSALVTFHLFEVNFKQMSTWTCRPNDMRSSVPSHASLYLRATPTPSARPTMVCFRVALAFRFLCATGWGSRYALQHASWALCGDVNCLRCL